MTGDDYMTTTTRVFLRLWYGGLKGIVMEYPDQLTY